MVWQLHINSKQVYGLDSIQLSVETRKGFLLTQKSLYVKMPRS